MSSEWKISEAKPIAKWKIGPRIWRINGEWRLRIYTPWKKKRFVETQSKSFLSALYFLGLRAGWWEHKVREDTSA